MIGDKVVDITSQPLKGNDIKNFVFSRQKLSYMALAEVEKKHGIFC